MKRTARLLPILAVGIALPSRGQVTSPSPSGQEDSDFEELSELQASEILKPEFLKGRYHTVQESVPTSSGMNRFTIDSQFGAFEAEGNEMLVRRVGEIDAIARLKDMSRTDVYKQALAKAAKAPADAAKRIAADPIATIENAPKGNHEIHQSRGESIKALGKKQGSDAYEGNQLIVKATSCSTSVTSSPPAAFLSANSSSVAGSTNVPVQRTRIQISRA